MLTGGDAILRVPYCKACHEYIGREKDLEEHLKSEKHFNNYYSSYERRDYDDQGPACASGLEVESFAETDFPTGSKSHGDRMDSRRDHYGREDYSRREKSAPRPLLNISREEIEPKSTTVSRQNISSRLESRELASCSRRVNWEDPSYSALSYNNDEYRSRDDNYRKSTSSILSASKVSKDWERSGKEKEEGEYGQLYANMRHQRPAYDINSHMRVSQTIIVENPSVRLFHSEFIIICTCSFNRV